MAGFRADPLMTQFAMIEARTRRADADRGEGRPKGALSCQMPHGIARSISPTIGATCSPGRCQLRPREDVEYGRLPRRPSDDVVRDDRGADAAGGCGSRRGETERCHSYQMPHRIVRSISPAIGATCSPGPCQLRHREDVEHGPASSSTLLMTWLAMLEGADAAGGCGSRKGETERCLSEKISILISAEGSTAGGGLSSPGCGCRSAPAPHLPSRELASSARCGVPPDPPALFRRSTFRGRDRWIPPLRLH
jgi:hypothetical protein